MDIDRGALLQVFLTDSEDDLARLEVEVLALESQPTDAMVDGVFRLAHTLKGNAGILSLDGFARLAHALEDVLHAVRARRLAISGDLASSLLAGVDALRTSLAAIRAGEPEDPAQHAALVAELAAWVEGTRTSGRHRFAMPALPLPSSKAASGRRCGSR
jgi:two-component system chemotaxis sensor kinase CheA